MMIEQIESIEDQLLHASLLCGMKPNEEPAYRLQLFFIANIDLESGSHQADFQRALETGVDQKGLWDNFGTKGSGEYVLTQRGYDIARRRFGDVKPRYVPARINGFRIRFEGRIDTFKLAVRIQGRRSTVFLDGLQVRAAEACRAMGLPTVGDSAVRVLYNLALDHGFVFQWEGRVAQ